LQKDKSFRAIQSSKFVVINAWITIIKQKSKQITLKSMELKTRTGSGLTNITEMNASKIAANKTGSFLIKFTNFIK
jgi:hypothetical protein